MPMIACKSMSRNLLELLFMSAVATVVLVTPALGTVCYSCHLTPGSNSCADARGLHEARLTYEAHVEYILNGTEGPPEGRVAPLETHLMSVCPDSMPFCVIESIIKAGQYILFYRDCSDGVNFSTSVAETRLAAAPRDNNTHCALSNKPDSAMMCVALCKGNFCNGPLSSASPPLLRSGFDAMPIFLLCVGLGEATRLLLEVV